MYRILLLGINARYTHSNPALFYLKKNISDLGLYVSLTEFTISETAGKIADSVINLKPDILAVSVYIWNASLVKKILKTIKLSIPDIKIILGGPEVSFNSEKWLAQFSEIDHIITGGGESAFRDLLLNDHTTGTKIIHGTNPHFSQIIFPYSDEDMKYLKGKYIYYESSRGCPFNCSYCLSSVKGQNVEFRTIDQVRDELDFFSSYDLPLVKFVDRTFNMKKDHYRPVWEHIVKRFSGKGTCFHFEIFPELLDEDDINFLSTLPSGLFQFEMGIQSTNLETLNAINRSGSWKRIEKIIKDLVSPGNIHIHTDLIAGLPFEDFKSFAGSFDKVYSLGAEHFQAGFLKVLPGTEMYNRTEEYGMSYSPLPPYEIIENRWISQTEMERLKFIGELVDLLHNSEKFPGTEKFLVSLYDGPFAFFNRLGDFFKRENNADHRRWESLAGMLLSAIGADYPHALPLLMDYLRWDWCSIMKHHHLPEILKSQSTITAKKRGYLFFRNISVNDIIDYDGTRFKNEDLRRSIFFTPDTDEFMKSMMTDKCALFLPDKQILFFNPDKLNEKIL